jgi:hypothetical protein
MPLRGGFEGEFFKAWANLSFRWDLFFGQEAKWSSAPPLPPHRRDESAASYSSAGCTPASPASASLAGFILKHPAATVNIHNERRERSYNNYREFWLSLTRPSA